MYKDYNCNYVRHDSIQMTTRDGTDGQTTYLRVTDGMSRAAVYLSQKDAEDMAWSILESYGTATRPVQPTYNEGDLVMVNNLGPYHRRYGRVVSVVGEGEFSYRVRFPENGYTTAFQAGELHKMTEDELLNYANRLAKATIDGEF